MTDAGLEKLAAGCPQLASLKLSGGGKVTAAGKALFKDGIVKR